MSEQDFHFVALLGSLRRSSLTRVIAETLDELAPDDVAVRLLAPVGALPHFNQDIQDVAFPEAVLAMGAAIGSADGLVIVTPEYNHSIPGALKNALDWLSRLPEQPLRQKPVAIQSASPGLLGGARCQLSVRATLASFDALVLNRPEVIIGRVAEKIDPERGILRDEDTRHAIARQLEALADLARRNGPPRPMLA